MSHSFRPTKARRALGVEQSPELVANGTDEDLSFMGLVRQGLAALAVSALGLAVAGSVALTASAQATETAASVAGKGNPDISQAVPAAQSNDLSNEQALNDRDKKNDQATADGQLDSFSRSADSTTRNAVRAELDKAVADQIARERGHALTSVEEKSSETSGKAIADARSTELVNQTAAQKREQARLAEEKRKAEEALKKAQESGSALPAPAAPAPEPAAPAAPAPAPQVNAGGGSNGQASTPIAPGSYTLGARWGAVGSWSRYHTGVDLPAPIGTPIRAASGGVVISPNGGGWAGTHVVIKHADGTATLYAHMNGATVRPGQMVTAGQTIGAVGMTGRTFGPHLHFEHYPSGAAGNPYTTDDPYSWLLRQGVRL